mmetsp:Transcript_19423/g.67673  ORF Transcript_19423/g.67673 Transcript_19423/m.67673 type:complete len:279 (+) Transcript_19423:2123-2959(+)
MATRDAPMRLPPPRCYEQVVLAEVWGLTACDQRQISTEWPSGQRCYLNVRCSAGRDVEEMQGTLGDFNPIGREAPREGEVRQRPEVVAIQNSDAAISEVDGFEGDWLHDFFGLMQGRVRRPVGLNEAVDAEVVIRWSVRPSEITAICPYILAVDLGGDALVNPIPDVTTLQDVVLVDHIPILLEASDAVPHRMSVLAHDERQSTRRALVELAILRQLCLARVHRAIDVGVRIDALDIVGLPSGIPAGVFVLHEPRGIPMLDPHVRGIHVDAVASLVRQ